MPILPIVIYPDPRLREKCQPVEQIDAELLRLLKDMAETMYQAPGIGLAAVQVGVMKRVIVVDLGEDQEHGRTGKLYKLINPEIVKSAGSIDYEEGCLSIPGVKEVVKRPSIVEVKALNEEGQEIKIEADGLLAVCLQHEIDHLNGILFIDHLSRIKRELIKSKLKQK